MITYIIQGFIGQIIYDKALARNNLSVMFLSYNTPHSPMQVPDSWWNRVKDRTLSQRATFPEQEDTTFTKAALALAENLDWNIGRVLSLLHSLDLEQETIVIYFSDNGPFPYMSRPTDTKRRTNTPFIRRAFSPFHSTIPPETIRAVIREINNNRLLFQIQ